MKLNYPARILVVGGGPSGSFFALRFLRLIRERGGTAELTLLEKKRELHFYEARQPFTCREGCNFCAGGISPRMVDSLVEEDLEVPEEILQGEVTSFTLQGGWKNVELDVPEGRRMILVYRGSMPKERSFKYLNFDSFLLDKARARGARIVTGEVRDAGYGGSGLPWVEFVDPREKDAAAVRLEADFVVFAAGMNQTPGAGPESNRLVGVARRMIPGFAPPRTRRTLIFELEASQELLEGMKGGVYFADFGSKELKIEMFSLVPKKTYVTVVLIGPVIDRSRPSENLQIIRRFLDLPHIRKLLPGRAVRAPACACNPNMTVGVARHPFHDRFALTGDMVVSRLYKDGIYSAFLTSSALARCLVDVGIDRASLEKGYGPTIRSIHGDNRYGRRIFRLNRIVFRHPVLDRMLYQSILTEKKSKPREKGRLAAIVWKIVSGDDSYRRIWLARLDPRVMLDILYGGAFITFRNFVTERLFGLRWRGFGRHPTGVSKEAVEGKRREYARRLALPVLAAGLDFEKMYSIKIRSGRDKILEQLGKFGDEDKEYFRPRLIRVKRTHGEPNERGSRIRYTTPFKSLTFSLVLEDRIDDKYVLYRVADGFAEGGVLIFQIEEIHKTVHLLTIYVAFDFKKGKGFLERAYRRAFRLFFPAFVHDVLWNHSLCKLKDVVEEEAAGSQGPGRFTAPPGPRLL